MAKTGAASDRLGGFGTLALSVGALLVMASYARRRADRRML
jgi:hypothetical protein